MRFAYKGLLKQADFLHRLRVTHAEHHLPTKAPAKVLHRNSPGTLKTNFMVTVNSYKVAQNKEGKDYVALELQGEIEAVQSSQTGKVYLTARSVWVPTTFNIAYASLLIGKQMPGNVRKEACQPYEYTIPETGEVISLAYQFVYDPEESGAAKQEVGNINTAARPQHA